MSAPANSRVRRLAVLAVVMAGAGLAVGALLLSGNGDGEAPIDAAVAPEDSAPPRRATKPPPPPNDYVGSAACAACHADVAESFAHHPMGRSACLAGGPLDPADYAQAGEHAPPGARTYRVERREGAVLHREILTDDDGQTLYDQAVPVTWAIGSGAHGASYAIDRGGALFVSPLGWYTSQHDWGLSPGYLPAEHPRFDRRITDGCIVCHTGRPNPLPEDTNRFAEPALLQTAIGCERCHGPGGRHVERQRRGASPSPDATIVNPARLPPAERDAVCNQCHLIGEHRVPRYGRTFYDFRPGMKLEDAWNALVYEENLGEDGRAKAITHVEQMRSSACYKESDGRLSCLSCHDPHAKPDPERAAAFFRQRCLQCHGDADCRLPPPERLARSADDSCVACHMPQVDATAIAHMSQTDHRILRLPGEVGFADEGAAQSRLTFLDRADERMPRWEVERVLGITLVEIAQTSTSPEQLIREAEDHLQAVLPHAPDDVPTLTALGTAAAVRGNHADAQRIFHQALRVSPANEAVLAFLAQSYVATGDDAQALDYLRQAMAVNPWHARDYALAAEILGRLDQPDEAIRVAERAIELDPTHLKARQWLVDAYARAGRQEESDRQADLLERIKRRLGR